MKTKYSICHFVNYKTFDLRFFILQVKWGILYGVYKEYDEGGNESVFSSTNKQTCLNYIKNHNGVLEYEN